MAITQEDCILAHPAEKKRKTPLDLLVLRRRGLVLCKILYPQPLRKPLSKGVGSLDHLNSSSSWIVLHPLRSSSLAQGWMCSKPLVPTTTTAISSVGVRIILPSNAPRWDNLKGKDSLGIIRTKARRRLCKSGKVELISPLLLNFLKELQLWRVHFLSITNPQLSYLILVHLIALLVLNLEQKLG